MAANKLPPREMLKRWDEARPIFVTAIAKAIDKKTRNNRRWVDQSGLIPVGVKASKFAAIFKKGLTPHVGGAFKCDLVDDSANLIMIRHAFGNKRYLWVGAKGTTDEEVLEAIRKYPKENARNESIASEFHQVCEDELVELCGMERHRGAEISATTPTITRRQERRNAVVNAPSPADQLETYPRHQQRRIVDDLAADAKRKDELEAILDRIEDEPAAADVIDFMMSQDDVADGAPMKLIQSMLARPSVRRTGHLLPRTESFAEAGERNQQNAVRILNAMMNKCAKLLLPNDGKEGRYLLIDAMIKSPIFRKYSLPSRKTNNELKYRQFATSPSVLAIKEAMETLGRSNENLRVQLLSVLKAYPMRWIQKLIPGVGRTTAGKGKFHAQVVGAGLSDEMAPNIVRNRRRGAVEEHFQGWLVENMIVLPNVNKDSNGRHVDAPITYLRQNRHQSLQSYRKDFEIAKSEGKEEENEGSGDSSDAEDDGEDSDDEVETYTDVDGEERTWYRWALKYQNQRIAKRGLDDKKEDIYLGTTVGSGYVGDKRKVTVRFDEQVVDYISDGDDDGDDDEKVADGYLEDMDEKELRRNFALYKSEGIRRERSSSVARGPRSPSQADEASTSVAASSALSYPQAQTGGRFVEVKVGEYGPNPRSDDEDDTDSEEEAEPRDVKVMSAKKKRKLDKEARAARVERGREERRQKLLHKEKERDERAKKVWPLKCSECERRFKGQHFMDQHVCHPSRAVSSSVVVGPNASLYAGRTGSDRSAPTLLTFENVKPLGSRSWRRLLMGHGISWGRESNPMNPAARKILVACFELGEQRGGGKRMSPYEMQQACLAELPSLICPEIQEIQRFISDQVNSRKKGESGDVEGGDGDNNGDGNNNAGPTIRRKFSRAEKEQKRAAVLKNDLFQLRADNSDLVEMRFNKKYVGKFLMQEKDSGDVRIVMDVKYCREQHLWYAETVEAEVDEIDDRKYSPLDNGTILNVYVGRGSTNLSKYIKQYNQWAELSK